MVGRAFWATTPAPLGNSDRGSGENSKFVFVLLGVAEAVRAN
jgi:hypothetical protein